MTSRLVALCIDANDPANLARFWANALRWDVGATADETVALVPTDGTRFTVVFQLVAEPKTERNQVHLDLTTVSRDDQQQSVEQLLALGARHIDIGQGPDDEHVVLADPEGNEFCIIEPTNNFLATCGRFGSITGNGSPAAGRFWSAALDWPLVWDQDDETAIRAPDGTGPFVTWGPPVPPPAAPNRLHLQVAPVAPADRRSEVDRLVARGANRTDDPSVLTGPDGLEFSIVPR